MVWLKDARLPEGLRVYAIGDVHGCLDQLRAVHSDIVEDLARRPVEDWRIVHVGDYVDRGPNSRGVLDLLAERSADPRVVCLLGNHDQALIDALASRIDRFPTWTIHGGGQTLAEYGLREMGTEDPATLGSALRRAVPETHQKFLIALPLTARYGDYFFVHAGVDPDRPLDGQEPRDLIWIRDRFLDSRREFEAVIVHGHTPVHGVEVRRNRIGIDTGAVFGRELTCLVLEGAGKSLLAGGRVEPLA